MLGFNIYPFPPWIQTNSSLTTTTVCDPKAVQPLWTHTHWHTLLPSGLQASTAMPRFLVWISPRYTGTVGFWPMKHDTMSVPPRESDDRKTGLAALKWNTSLKVTLWILKCVKGFVCIHPSHRDLGLLINIFHIYNKYKGFSFVFKKESSRIKQLHMPSTADKVNN